MNERFLYKITIHFKWYDLWVGAFIDRKNETLYICLIPTIVIKIKRIDIYAKREKTQKRKET